VGQQLQAGAHLPVGQIGVRATLAGALSQAGWADISMVKAPLTRVNGLSALTHNPQRSSTSPPTEANKCSSESSRAADVARLVRRPVSFERLFLLDVVCE
jgi:hypothetical protein